MLRIVYRNKARRMSKASGRDELFRGLGPQGRIDRLRKIVTALIRHERLEGSWNFFDEARTYAELLIQRAQKHGNKHKETMELADYWLLEKDLIPKLFEVIAPRYQGSLSSCTRMYVLPTDYTQHPAKTFKQGIIELKGNPYPPVIPHVREVRGSLVNVLVNEMKKDYHKQKQIELMQVSATEDAEDPSADTTGVKEERTEETKDHSSSIDEQEEDIDTFRVRWDMRLVGGQYRVPKGGTKL